MKKQSVNHSVITFVINNNFMSKDTYEESKLKESSRCSVFSLQELVSYTSHRSVWNVKCEVKRDVSVECSTDY